jgi:hypothetical protein
VPVHTSAASVSDADELDKRKLCFVIDRTRWLGGLEAEAVFFGNGGHW